MIPFLSLVILLFLYLYLIPPSSVEQRSVDSVKIHTAIESMMAILPGDDRIKKIKEDVTLISKITEGIKRDKIACIIPTKEEIKKLKNDTKIVFPDSAAFGGGDAILGSENILKQKNPLLEIVKVKERKIHTAINDIQLALDVKGDKFKTRFMKKSIIVKNEIDEMKNKIVSGCSRQKIRLRKSHPHLSNYEFINEHVSNGATISPPNYVHGKSLTPVGRDDKLEDSNFGLMQEFFSF